MNFHERLSNALADEFGRAAVPDCTRAVAIDAMKLVLAEWNGVFAETGLDCRFECRGSEGWDRFEIVFLANDSSAHFNVFVFESRMLVERRGGQTDEYSLVRSSVEKAVFDRSFLCVRSILSRDDMKRFIVDGAAAPAAGLSQ